MALPKSWRLSSNSSSSQDISSRDDGGFWAQAWQRGSREALAGAVSVFVGLALWEGVRMWQRYNFSRKLARDLNKGGLANVVVAGSMPFDAIAVSDVLQEFLPGVKADFVAPEAEISIPDQAEVDREGPWNIVRKRAKRHAEIARNQILAAQVDQDSLVSLRLAVGMYCDVIELDPETQIPIVWVEVIDVDSGRSGSACQVGGILARREGKPPVQAFLRHEAVELAWEQFVQRS